MSWMETTRFWRRLGRAINTKPGAAVAKAAGGVINGYTAAMMTPRLKDDAPWVFPTKPLSESKVAIVTTAGFHLTDQEPFDVDSQNGDPTFRELPGDVALSDLVATHTHYPHRYVDADKNVVLPLDRLHELEAAGAFTMAPRIFSWGFVGTQTSALIDPRTGTATKVAESLVNDQVDLALLVPA